MAWKAGKMMLLTGKARKNKGFLLLEIMVSVSILSLGVLLILNSFIRPLRAMEFSKDCFRAGLLLDQKVFELYNSNTQEGCSKGVFSDFNEKFSWEMDASEKEVNLRVFWNERDKEGDLTALIYL